MTRSTVTSKGQTTIPKEIRERFHLKPGDQLEYVPEEGKFVVIPVKRSIVDLYGYLSAPSNPLSLEEMDRAVEDEAAGL